MLFQKIFKSNLLKTSLIYILTDGIYQGIPFLILPILSFYLTPQDYGIVANFTIISNLFIILFGLSSESYLSINFYKISNLRKISFIQSYLIIVAGTFLFLSIVLYFTKDVIIGLFDFPQFLLVPVLIYSLTQKVENFYLQILRFENKKYLYFLLRTFHTILNVSISLILVIKLNQSFTGRVTGMLISSVIIFSIPLFNFYKNKVFNIPTDSKVIKGYFTYGSSLIPHSLSNWFKAGFDRAFITNNFGLAENGLYSSGSQVGLLLGLIITAINKAFSPFIFNEMSNSKTVLPPKLKKFIIIFIPLLIIGTLFFSYLGNIFIKYFFNNAYKEATDYVLLISISQAINGLYLLLVNFVFFYKKTIHLSSISIFSTLVHIISSYLLINKYQALGAAYANVISNTILALGVIVIILTQIKNERIQESL